MKCILVAWNNDGYSYLHEQSSRVFKANRIISTKTGKTTHSFDLGFCFVLIDDDIVLVDG